VSKSELSADAIERLVSGVEKREDGEHAR